MARTSAALIVRGRLEKHDGVINLIADRLDAITPPVTPRLPRLPLKVKERLRRPSPTPIRRYRSVRQSRTGRPTRGALIGGLVGAALVSLDRGDPPERLRAALQRAVALLESD